MQTPGGDCAGSEPKTELRSSRRARTGVGTPWWQLTTSQAPVNKFNLNDGGLATAGRRTSTAAPGSNAKRPMLTNDSGEKAARMGLSTGKVPKPRGGPSHAALLAAEPLEHAGDDVPLGPDLTPVTADGNVVARGGPMGDVDNPRQMDQQQQPATQATAAGRPHRRQQHRQQQQQHADLPTFVAMAEIKPRLAGSLNANSLNIAIAAHNIAKVEPGVVAGAGPGPVTATQAGAVPGAAGLGTAIVAVPDQAVQPADATSVPADAANARAIVEPSASMPADATLSLAAVAGRRHAVQPSVCTDVEAEPARQPLGQAMQPGQQIERHLERGQSEEHPEQPEQRITSSMRRQARAAEPVAITRALEQPGTSAELAGQMAAQGTAAVDNSKPAKRGRQAKSRKVGQQIASQAQQVQDQGVCASDDKLDGQQQQVHDPAPPAAAAAGRPRRATAELAKRRLKGDQGAAPPDLFALKRSAGPGGDTTTAAAPPTKALAAAAAKQDKLVTEPGEVTEGRGARAASGQTTAAREAPAAQADHRRQPGKRLRTVMQRSTLAAAMPGSPTLDAAAAAAAAAAQQAAAQAIQSGVGVTGKEAQGSLKVARRKTIDSSDNDRGSQSQEETLDDLAGAAACLLQLGRAALPAQGKEKRGARQQKKPGKAAPKRRRSAAEGSAQAADFKVSSQRQRQADQEQRPVAQEQQGQELQQPHGAYERQQQEMQDALVLHQQLDMRQGKRIRVAAGGQGVLAKSPHPVTVVGTTVQGQGLGHEADREQQGAGEQEQRQQQKLLKQSEAVVPRHNKRRRQQRRQQQQQEQEQQEQLEQQGKQEQQGRHEQQQGHQDVPSGSDDDAVVPQADPAAAAVAAGKTAVAAAAQPITPAMIAPAAVQVPADDVAMAVSPPNEATVAGAVSDVVPCSQDDFGPVAMPPVPSPPPPCGQPCLAQAGQVAVGLGSSIEQEALLRLPDLSPAVGALSTVAEDANEVSMPGPLGQQEAFEELVPRMPEASQGVWSEAEEEEEDHQPVGNELLDSLPWGAAAYGHSDHEEAVGPGEQVLVPVPGMKNAYVAATAPSPPLGLLNRRKSSSTALEALQSRRWSQAQEYEPSEYELPGDEDEQDEEAAPARAMTQGGAAHAGLAGEEQGLRANDLLSANAGLPCVSGANEEESLLIGRQLNGMLAGSLQQQGKVDWGSGVDAWGPRQPEERRRRLQRESRPSHQEGVAGYHDTAQRERQYAEHQHSPWHHEQHHQSQLQEQRQQQWQQQQQHRPGRQDVAAYLEAAQQERQNRTQQREQQQQLQQQRRRQDQRAFYQGWPEARASQTVECDGVQGSSQVIGKGIGALSQHHEQHQQQQERWTQQQHDLGGQQLMPPPPPPVRQPGKSNSPFRQPPSPEQRQQQRQQSSPGLGRPMGVREAAGHPASLPPQCRQPDLVPESVRPGVRTSPSKTGGPGSIRAMSSPGGAREAAKQLPSSSCSGRPAGSSTRPTTSAAALSGPSCSSSGRPRPSSSATALLLERVLKQTAAVRAKGGGIKDDWSTEQVQALQSAYFRVDPTHPAFWQEVAKKVPGRTAGECFSKVHDRHLPWEERAKLRGSQRRPEPPTTSAATGQGLQQGLEVTGPGPSARGGSGMTAAGGIKKPTLPAARKWARNLQMQAQIERLAGAGTSNASAGGQGTRGAAAADGSHSIVPPELEQLHPELAEAMKARENADRYISSFLRKAGGWSKWQRTCKQGQERRMDGLTMAAAGPSGQRGPGVAGGAAGMSGVLASVLQGAHLVQQQEEDGDECEGDAEQEEQDDDEYMYQMEEEEEAEASVAAMAAAAGLAKW